MTNKRIQVIDKISAPKNVKGLQRLLGMFVYWKKLVPFFFEAYIQYAATVA